MKEVFVILSFFVILRLSAEQIRVIGRLGQLVKRRACLGQRP
ncbi:MULTISPECIES: hypothetical protein [unclassified Bradyrhizobium]|nr:MULTISPECIES: hypothetical protein [unclassified Bradyrhizobium]